MPITAAILLASASISGSSPFPLLQRALSCQLDKSEVPTLMAGLEQDLRGEVAMERQYAAPSGDLYRLSRPVTALGYSSTLVYVQPGRIAILLDSPQETVSKALRLEPAPYSPDSRQIAEDVSLVAWQSHQDGLAGKTLLGCEYRVDAAGLWLEQIEGRLPRR